MASIHRNLRTILTNTSFRKLKQNIPFLSIKKRCMVYYEIICIIKLTFIRNKNRIIEAILNITVLTTNFRVLVIYKPLKIEVNNGTKEKITKGRQSTISLGIPKRNSNISNIVPINVAATETIFPAVRPYLTRRFFFCPRISLSTSAAIRSSIGSH